MCVLLCVLRLLKYTRMACLFCIQQIIGATLFVPLWGKGNFSLPRVMQHPQCVCFDLCHQFRQGKSEQPLKFRSYSQNVYIGHVGKMQTLFLWTQLNLSVLMNFIGTMEEKCIHANRGEFNRGSGYMPPKLSCQWKGHLPGWRGAQIYPQTSALRLIDLGSMFWCEPSSNHPANLSHRGEKINWYSGLPAKLTWALELWGYLWLALPTTLHTERFMAQTFQC